MDIINNIKNILKHSFSIMLLIACFSTVAVTSASAKTIDNSILFVDETRLEYFNNLFKRSEFNYYLLGVVNDSYSSYSYSNYYFCLSNEEIVFEDSLNAKGNCDEMYRYYRTNNTSNYVLEKVNDKSLNINNSVYYFDTKIDYNYYFMKFIILLNIILVTFMLIYILIKIFGGVKL